MGQKTKTKDDYEKTQEPKPPASGWAPARKPAPGDKGYVAPPAAPKTRRPAAPGSEPGSGFKKDPR